VAKKLSELVAGADRRVAEAALPGQPGDADLARNHLPKPLRPGSRHAQEGARRTLPKTQFLFPINRVLKSVLTVDGQPYQIEVQVFVIRPIDRYWR
jgi:hypothetical protein